MRIKLPKPFQFETDYKGLMSLAQFASTKAYAPYSKFHVGAVVVTRHFIYHGCNFENAAYGSTICAERNAIGTMIADGITIDNKIEAVLIYTPTPHPSAPCGACRQVINEFSPQAKIVSFCDSNEILITTSNELLPNAFGPKNLT